LPQAGRVLELAGVWFCITPHLRLFGDFMPRRRCCGGSAEGGSRRVARILA
jgi:hypothetical protein